MTVQIYRSDDPSAPILNGTTGSLINVLDTCLVNGYGARSAAGWTKPFSSGSIGVYRAASGNRMFMRVDDSGSLTTRVLGYEDMTAASTGTGQFPTNAQLSGGIFIQKSSTADTTNRPWVLAASPTFLIFLPLPSRTHWLEAIEPSVNRGQFCFGEIISYKPGDAFNTILIGQVGDAGGSARLGTIGQSTVHTGHFIARSYLQIGSSQLFGKHPLIAPFAFSDCVGSGSSSSLVPDPVSGGILVSRLAVLERPNVGSSQFALRGIIPGYWAALHFTILNHGDRFFGNGSGLSGREFQIFDTHSNSTVGRGLLELSNTWYT